MSIVVCTRVNTEISGIECQSVKVAAFIAFRYLGYPVAKYHRGENYRATRYTGLLLNGKNICCAGVEGGNHEPKANFDGDP